jgi:hypothetical protein
MAEWVWMRNVETGGVQRFAAAAVEAWQDMGWEPCDPPAEANAALDPNHPALVQAREAETAQAPIPAETPGDGPGRKQRTGRAPATEQEE